MIHQYIKFLWTKKYRINPDYTFEGFTVVIVNKGTRIMNFINQHWEEIKIDE